MRLSLIDMIRNYHAVSTNSPGIAMFLANASYGIFFDNFRPEAGLGEATWLLLLNQLVLNGVVLALVLKRKVLVTRAGPNDKFLIHCFLDIDIQHDP